jgi:hypothetical protein
MKTNQRNYLWLFIGAIVMSIGVPLVVYYLNFRTLSISSNPSDWAAFGDYLGGTSNTFLALVNLGVVILIALKIYEMETQRELELHDLETQREMKLQEMAEEREKNFYELETQREMKLQEMAEEREKNFYELETQREKQLQEIALKPFCEFIVTAKNDHLSILIKNFGNGPAIIHSIVLEKLTTDGIVPKTIDELIPEDQGIAYVDKGLIDEKTCLGAGYEVNILTIENVDNTSEPWKFNPFYRKALDNLSAIDIVLNYTNIFDNTMTEKRLNLTSLKQIKLIN